MASEHTLVEESDRSDLALLKPLLLLVRLLTPLLLVVLFLASFSLWLKSLNLSSMESLCLAGGAGEW